MMYFKLSPNTLFSNGTFFIGPPMHTTSLLLSGLTRDVLQRLPLNNKEFVGIFLSW